MDKKTQKTFEQLLQEQRLREAGFVQDRRTGEWYNPKERFDAMMNLPEIQAVFRRLAVR